MLKLTLLMSLLNPGRKPGAKSNIEVHAGITDFYKYYKDNNEEPLDYQTYAKALKEINKAISSAIMYENFDFKMPGRLGNLSIVKKKHKLKTREDGKVDTRYLPVDFKKTKELWARIYSGLSEEEILQIPNRKRVFHTNTHSDGYIYSWYYNKFTSNATNKSVYYFKPTRTNSRDLTKYVKSEDFEGNFFEYTK